MFAMGCGRLFEGTPEQMHRSLSRLGELPEDFRLYNASAAVVARARSFVGTYGGFAYLAPFYGVPSTGYYSNPAGFARSHLAMAQSAFERIGSAGLLRVEPVAEGRALAGR